jgi:hypothetical protein
MGCQQKASWGDMKTIIFFCNLQKRHGIFGFSTFRHPVLLAQSFCCGAPVLVKRRLIRPVP